MTTEHLLDSELLPILQQMPAFHFTRENLPKFRRELRRQRSGMPRLQAATRIHHHIGSQLGRTLLALYPESGKS